MADKKITALTAETDIDSDDLAHIVTDVSTSATNKKITVANVFNKIPTFIGYGADSVETVAADGALSTTKAISILAASGTTTVQTTLADVTQIGFTKHIIRAGTSSGAHDVEGAPREDGVWGARWCVCMYVFVSCACMSVCVCVRACVWRGGT